MNFPDYAKDVKLTLSGAMQSDTLSPVQRHAVALAAAVSAGHPCLDEFLNVSELDEVSKNGALAAAAVMGMTNVWYSYVKMSKDAELANEKPMIRMMAYQNHGGADPFLFEMCALGASIVGKCENCISSHVSELRKQGVSSAQLRDIGRIAAAVKASALVT